MGGGTLKIPFPKPIPVCWLLRPLVSRSFTCRWFAIDRDESTNWFLYTVSDMGWFWLVLRPLMFGPFGPFGPFGGRVESKLPWLFQAEPFKLFELPIFRLLTFSSFSIKNSYLGHDLGLGCVHVLRLVQSILAIC